MLGIENGETPYRGKLESVSRIVTNADAISVVKRVAKKNKKLGCFYAPHEAVRFLDCLGGGNDCAAIAVSKSLWTKLFGWLLGGGYYLIVTNLIVDSLIRSTPAPSCVGVLVNGVRGTDIERESVLNDLTEEFGKLGIQLRTYSWDRILNSAEVGQFFSEY